MIQVHDSDMGQHRFPYCDHLYCCTLLRVFLVCEWKTEKGESFAGEDNWLQIYLLIRCRFGAHGSGCLTSSDTVSA